MRIGAICVGRERTGKLKRSETKCLEVDQIQQTGGIETQKSGKQGSTKQGVSSPGRRTLKETLL